MRLNPAPANSREYCARADVQTGLEACGATFGSHSLVRARVKLGELLRRRAAPDRNA